MSSSILFSIIDKEIVVTDLKTGAVVWAGRPLNRQVIDMAQLSQTSQAIILLEYYGTPADERQNLVAIDKDGRILWRSTLPTNASTDAYTEMELLVSGVSAFSWSGHRVLIDLISGEIVDDQFAK